MTQPPTAPSASGSEREPDDSRARRIVLADDEALIRLDLAEMLEDAGYEIVGQAPDGQQAVELVRSLTPDLAVLDVKMPVMDGLSAAEEIGRERICPVVMLTAFSQKELVERARDAGVMAYVVKPFTAGDIAPAIDIALSRWSEISALEAEVADVSGWKILCRGRLRDREGTVTAEAEGLFIVPRWARDRVGTPTGDAGDFDTKPHG